MTEQRLIDLDKAMEATRKEIYWTESRAADVRAFLIQQPRVDAVPVVRCKDCKHYVQFLQDNKECRCTIFSGCYDRPYPTEPNDFCSYGEKREV